MQTENLKEIIYSRNVLEFVTVAHEYCSFLERAGEFDQYTFSDKTIKLLTVVYLKGTLLPEVELINEEGNEKFVTELDWEFIRNGVLQQLNDNDTYLDFFDSEMNETPEPVTTSISENIADIYQDLKDFISIYQLGIDELANDAIYECYSNFKTYWGQRVLNSLRILHFLIYSNKLSNTDTFENEPKQPKTDNWFISQAQKNYRKDAE